jgi:hypothetical protein
VNDARTWWRCTACLTKNPPRQSTCSKCSAFRYAILGNSLQCKTCSSAFPLTPETVKFDPQEDWLTGLRCFVCREHLHGAVGSSEQKLTICACGATVFHRSVTCRFCRLPQSFPSAAVADKIMSSWHFGTNTDWCCLSCFTVNKACFATVGIIRKSGKRGRVYHAGDATCRNADCGKKWHNEPVNDGWRCACGTINKAMKDKASERSGRHQESRWSAADVRNAGGEEGMDDILPTACFACGRPRELTDTKMITFWLNGDRLCPACKQHVHGRQATCPFCDAALRSEKHWREDQDGQGPRPKTTFSPSPSSSSCTNQRQPLFNLS